MRQTTEPIKARATCDQDSYCKFRLPCVERLPINIGCAGSSLANRRRLSEPPAPSATKGLRA